MRKKLVSLSIPMIIVGFCQVGIGSIDTLFAGRFSTVDLAGVALGSMIWLPIMLFVTGVISALTPFASGYYSSRSYELEQKSLIIALQYSFILGIFFAACLYAAPTLIQLWTADQKWLIAGQYLRLVSFSILFSALFQVVKSKLEARDNTVLCMIATVSAFIINIPLNYFFVNGSVLTRPMGGAGSGLATSITFGLSFFLLWFLAHFFHTDSRSLVAPIDQSSQHIRRVSHLEFLKLGFPIGLTAFSEIGMFVVLAFLMVPYGEHVVGAHQVVMSITGLIFVVPMSVGAASTILVSQAIGESDYTCIADITHQALKVGLCFVALTTVLLGVLSQYVIGLFSADDLILSIATPLLLIALCSQFFDVLQTVLASVLKGMMDTAIPFVIMSIGSWVVALPLGLFFSSVLKALGFSMPYVGYYISFFIALILISAFLYARYRFIVKQQISAV